LIQGVVMLVIAEYCETESRTAGTSDNQYKAALKLVEEAMNDMSRIDALEIEVTKDEIYRAWWRLKLKNAPAATYRAIIEIEQKQVTLHVVLPRGSRTYNEVKALWEKYRSKK
jgi:hypothetical protein